MRHDTASSGPEGAPGPWLHRYALTAAPVFVAVLALGLEDLDADVARAQASYRTVAVDHAEIEPARRQALPDHLSREEITFDVDEGRSVPAAAVPSI